MSLDSIQLAALASGGVAASDVDRRTKPETAAPAERAPTPAAAPPVRREPIDLGALSIAPRDSSPDWTPPPRAARPAPENEPAYTAAAPDTPRGPIDLASLSIAPTDTAKKGRGRRRSNRPLKPHEEVYDISPEELAERLAERRAKRRTPSLQRGDLTNYHRIAAAMEPRRWYTAPAVEHLTDITPNSIAPTLARMSRWPLLYLEREERPDRPPPFLVPAPYGRGGRTLRSPARWRYRLTANGEDLRRDALDRPGAGIRRGLNSGDVTPPYPAG